MTLPSPILPYGLRDVKLIEYPTFAATAFGTELIDLPVAQTFSFTESEDYTELRGDDKLVASHGQGPQLDAELEAGGISLEAYEILDGGNAVTSGVTPNITTRYRKLVTDQRPYFTVIGKAISDSGGDLHAIVYRARVTGDLGGEFADGEFYITGASMTGFGCLVEGLVDTVEVFDALYDFLQNEEIQEIVAPAIDGP